MDTSDEILSERRGAAGLIALNRPQALNALTLGMVRTMRRLLDEWAADPGVSRVVVTGAGEKAFCAGGDIRRLYDLGRAGHHAEAKAFWREEYELNILIKRYPKAYVALIDGIVMGGGVGVSLHGSHRVAGDRTVFAMPEVGIGFFPDVGATYALPRLPGRTGRYLALTGERLKAADAVALGIANRMVASADHPALRDALCDGEPVEDAIHARAQATGPAPLDEHRAVIDSCFSAESVPAILARLDQAGETSPFAAKTAATIRAKSPTSLVIALEQMRRGEAMDFEEAMALEFRIVSRILDGSDFYEGVRATIIDKDGKPRWSPADLAGVTDDLIAPYFAPLGDAELLP
ncbi:MAG TPA: enoyl-CoA hydratase/isomerase family protein [Beijerinckiaceae bacterium]|jgi:enoyl-CoA hydratase